MYRYTARWIPWFHGYELLDQSYLEQMADTYRWDDSNLYTEEEAKDCAKDYTQSEHNTREVMILSITVEKIEPCYFAPEQEVPS